MTTPLIEAIARKQCEQHIREVRRWDTGPAKLEAMLPGAVDVNWQDHVALAQAALTAITEAGYAVVPVSEGNPKCEADCARHWTGVRNKNADLRRTVAALEDEIVEAVEHLEAVLFSDPGPKMLASIGSARAWWLKRDAISAAQGDG